MVPQKHWQDDVRIVYFIMNENEIAKSIVDASYHVYRTLGPGLFESVYEKVLAFELERRGLFVVRQVPISLQYETLHFEEAFRADIVVNGGVLVEIKSVDAFLPVHHKQVLTYLRFTRLHLGLLINFGASSFRNAVRRVARNLVETDIRLSRSFDEGVDHKDVTD